ncbi:MAG: ABC transporter permease [Chloroflexia bacterium]|nr:ABC transporter permease [Chloroflexia bacterium]
MTFMLRLRNRPYVAIAILSVLVALVMVLPRQLAQPMLYQTHARIMLDVQRYHELFDVNGQLDQDFRDILYQARAVMNVRHPGFGEPQMAEQVVWRGTYLDVAITANTPALAATLSNEYADVLIMTIQAAGGREILRNVLGWEVTLALRGTPANDNETRILRDFVRLGVFTFNRPIEPIAKYTRVHDLPFADQSDLLRAVEWHRMQIEQTQSSPQNPEIALQQRDMLQSMREFEAVMLAADPHLAFNPTIVGVLYRVGSAPIPLEALPRYLWLIIGATILGGLLFAAIVIWFDRSVGIVARSAEIWSYRVLIEHLVRRNLLIRYRGSILGFAWTQIAPLMQLLVYWVVFGYFFPGNTLALYPLFIACALLPWAYTADAIATAVRSISDNAPLVRQTYFPREVLPIASVLTSMVNFLLSLPMLILFQCIVRYIAQGTVSLPWTIAYLPIILLVHTLFVLGFALFLTALAVYSLDVIHFVGIFLQVWFFLTPIVYSLNGISSSLARVLRWCNPMASFVEYYREILYGQPVASGLFPTPGIPASESIVRSLLVSMCVMGVGYWLFRRVHDYISEKL